MIGWIASCLTTASFIPQAVQVIKTKCTQGISLPMYIMFVSGVCLWLVHGIQVQDTPLIMANVVTLIFASIVLFYKIKYK